VLLRSYLSSMADEDSSDLAALWQEALADFKGSTKLDLTQWHFTSMQNAIDSTQQQKVKFDDWRHDKGKIDHVRSLLGNNLNNIQKVVTGKQSCIMWAAKRRPLTHLQARRWQLMPPEHSHPHYLQR
jgi:hypothetical protein